MKLQIEGFVEKPKKGRNSTDISAIISEISSMEIPEQQAVLVKGVSERICSRVNKFFKGHNQPIRLSYDRKTKATRIFKV